MPSPRRDPRSGARGTRRPGSSPRQRTTRGRGSSLAAPTAPPEPLASSSPSRSAAASTRRTPPARRPRARRPRFTGRAAVLVLVLAVLTVSYASSLRAYLQQRSHIGDLKTAIAEREASIDALEREKRRWEDPAFVRAQARARFGYLMPGETGFVVLDQQGRPLEAQAELNDPADVVKTVPTAWWDEAWASMELAGDPPAPTEGPADKIVGSDQQQ